MHHILTHQVQRAARRLMSEQNRDPHQTSYGCFDRRYWGWKTIDFPEATYQRNVYCFAWLLKHPELCADIPPDILKDAIIAGLNYSEKIQKPNGSFDQAFPNEHSFGATAFLIIPLLEAYCTICNDTENNFKEKIERCLKKAADFLCKGNEPHGHIANHLAGASAALFTCFKFFNLPKYEQRAKDLLDMVLDNQDEEGWFLEYEGADPGYQTLCTYYLAKIYHLEQDNKLRFALQRAVEFNSYFAHPDGSFGGQYGSRRTAIFYPGGLALLAKEFPVARALFNYMLTAIKNRRTILLDDIDMGNLAPLLENYCAGIDIQDIPADDPPFLLPCQREDVCHNFPQAGLAIRANANYYAIIGISNGGTLKVFDKKKQKNIFDDAGYIGQTKRGSYVTTQITDLKKEHSFKRGQIVIRAQFYKMNRTTPTPLLFLALRFLNLTVMQSTTLCSIIKRVLAVWFIRAKRAVPLHLERTIIFNKKYIKISDLLRGKLHLRWLECGGPFVAVHMASARYFEGMGGILHKARQIPLKSPKINDVLHHKVEIWSKNE
jgi:hypothetical protein